MYAETEEERQDHRDQLHELLEAGEQQAASELITEMHPAEIADALEGLPRELRPDLWQTLDGPAKGQILLELHDEVRQQLIDCTSDDDLLAAIVSLEMDELADLDEDLPAPVIEALLRVMGSERRRRYDAVRSYRDNTAGGLMDIDAATVRADVTLGAVLRYLRQLRSRDGALPEHMDSVMVVDRNNVFLGVLRLSDAVSLDSATVVRDAMSTGVPAIAELTPASKVARLFEHQDLISAPVVNEAGHLIGRITIDDVVDVMREEAEQDLMSRAGLSGATDMFAPLLSTARRRAVWLGIHLVNAFIAAWVIGLFEESIDKIVALAVLMPVIAGMGGVAGNQTLTLVTRGLALDQVRRSNTTRLLLREIASGLLNGVFWAFVVAAVAVAWFGSVNLGIAFGLALVINLLTGAVAGTLLPLALQRLGIDPALAGGVVLTAATDIIGFSAFLGLATLLLL